MKEAGDSKENIREWVNPKLGSDEEEADKKDGDKEGKEDEPKTEYGPTDLIHPNDEERLEDAYDM